MLELHTQIIETKSGCVKKNVNMFSSKCQKHYLGVQLKFQNLCIIILDKNLERREVLKQSEMWSTYDGHIGKNGKIDINI